VVRCTKCKTGPRLVRNSHASARMLPSVLATLALVAAGVALQFFLVGWWAWVFYGLGGIIALRALVIWIDGLFAQCPHCYATTIVWPWSREE
jgi:hypothetical protein